jgi:hypothetical protein
MFAIDPSRLQMAPAEATVHEARTNYRARLQVDASTRRLIG